MPDFNRLRAWVWIVVTHPEVVEEPARIVESRCPQQFGAGDALMLIVVDGEADPGVGHPQVLIGLI
jgi:hypothetical protein